MSTKIEPINIDITHYLSKEHSKSVARESITVCILQLFSPFMDGDGCMDVAQHQGHLCFTWLNNDAYRNRIERVNKIMNSISTLNKSRNIDILVFPEYAFPESSLSVIQSFSRSENIIIISNHYCENKRHNITYVIMPDGTTKYESLKFTQSEYEKDYLEKISHAEHIIQHFTWNHGSGKSYFQIYACLDFLNFFIPPYVNNELPGIIFVPMSSPEISEFEAISKFVIRTGETCSINKAVVLANASSRRRMHRSMCGSSQIIAPLRSTLAKLDKFAEGAIIVDIAPSYSLSQPTPLFRENSIVKSLVTFKYDVNGNISETVEDSNSKFSINPNIFKKIGLSKLYVFFKVREYNHAKTILMKLPISCNGIFGVHDILFQSYEENYDFFKIRLEHYLGLKEGLLEDAETYPITECYKFRGKDLVKENIQKHDDNVALIEGTATAIEIDKNKEVIRHILIGGEVEDPQIIQKLLDKGVLIAGTGRSDISQSEQSEGFEEFLTFIFFLEREIIKLKDSIDKFKRRIIPLLIKDDRIRTIEMSGNVFGGPSIAACCILHIVGTLNDMRGIILDDLNKYMSEYDILYGTRMVPVAEPLSRDMYLALQEIQTKETTSGTVLEIIHFLKGYEDPFMIKRIPDKEMERICSLYDDYKEWIGRHPGLQAHKPRYLRSIDEFIYGIAYAVISTEEDFDPKLYAFYSERFIISLYKMCEESIHYLLVKKGNEVGQGNFIAMVNSFKDKKGASLNYSFKETTLGKSIQAAIYWNDHCKPEEQIINNEFTNKLKTLHDFVQIRNIIAHHSTKKPKISEIDTLLNYFFTVLNFLKEYFPE